MLSALLAQIAWRIDHCRRCPPGKRARFTSLLRGEGEIGERCPSCERSIRTLLVVAGKQAPGSAGPLFESPATPRGVK